jgi:hypothetical protein
MRKKRKAKKLPKSIGKNPKKLKKWASTKAGHRWAGFSN